MIGLQRFSIRSLRVHMIILFIICFSLWLGKFIINTIYTNYDIYIISKKIISERRLDCKRTDCINICNFFGNITVVPSEERTISLEVVATARAKQPDLLEVALSSFSTMLTKHDNGIDVAVVEVAAADHRVNRVVDVKIRVPRNLELNLNNIGGIICVGCYYDEKTGALCESAVSLRKLSIISLQTDQIYAYISKNNSCFFNPPCVVDICCNKGAVTVEGWCFGRARVGNQSRLILPAGEGKWCQFIFPPHFPSSAVVP